MSTDYTGSKDMGRVGDEDGRLVAQAWAHGVGVVIGVAALRMDIPLHLAREVAKMLTTVVATEQRLQ